MITGGVGDLQNEESRRLPTRPCQLGTIMKNKSQFGRQQQKPLQNVLPTKSPALASTLSQALALHQAGRLAEAEKNYLQILKAQPDQFDCLHLLGVIFSQRGNHAEAVRQIDVALKINPKAPSAHNNRGFALQALKRLDQAIGSLNAAGERGA